MGLFGSVNNNLNEAYKEEKLKEAEYADDDGIYEECYAPEQDITFIMKWSREGESGSKGEVTGFYHGKPDESATKQFRNKPVANYDVPMAQVYSDEEIEKYLGEGCSKERKLKEGSMDLDEVSKEYKEAYGEDLDLNHVPCVKALDTFLSGWGGAEGKNHYQIVLCKDSTEAANIEYNMKRVAKSEGLSRIRRDFNGNIPKGASGSYVIGKNASAWK